MIANSFVNILNGFILRLYDRQWAVWEILAIAITSLSLLLWIMMRLRRRSVRSFYENQSMGSSPVIGVNLGDHKGSRHVMKELKKGRLTAVQKKHPKQQKSAKQTEPSEKLHEQIKQLQLEIIKRKQAEVRFEERFAHLTAANEQLQHELAESKQAAETPAAEEQLQPEVPVSKQAEQKVIQEPATDEKQQPEISESEQVEQVPERQVVAEPAADKPVEEKSAGKGNKYDDFHRVADDVKQKLCRKCKEWKPESEFHKNASSKDGLAASCKTCKAEAAREYRKRRKAAKD